MRDRYRMRKVWVYMFHGMTAEEAFMNADRDIDELREKIRIEGLKAFDSLKREEGNKNERQ